MQYFFPRKYDDAEPYICTSLCSGFHRKLTHENIFPPLSKYHSIDIEVCNYKAIEKCLVNMIV